VQLIQASRSPSLKPSFFEKQQKKASKKSSLAGLTPLKKGFLLKKKPKEVLAEGWSTFYVPFPTLKLSF